jgi:hypothetical protein
LSLIFFRFTGLEVVLSPSSSESMHKASIIMHALPTTERVSLHAEAGEEISRYLCRTIPRGSNFSSPAPPRP